MFRPVRLGSLGHIVTGRTPAASNPHYFGKQYPFITPTDIKGDVRYVETERGLSEAGGQAFQRVLLPQDAVCVVCIGATIGKVCMTNRPSATNQQINSIVVNPEQNDPYYVFAAARLLQDELRAKAGGAATPIINKGSFSDVEIFLPDLPAQRRIADVLSAYDDLIEVNQRRIAILEEMARRLFEEWFVRFHYPGHEAVPLVETELGPAPEGWRVGHLQDVVVLQRGFDLPATKRSIGSVPIYSATGQYGTHHESKVAGPSVVTGRSGSLGTVMHVEEEFWPLNTTLWGREFPLGSTYFAYFKLRELPFSALNGGAAVPTLNRNHVHAIPALIPPKEIVLTFERLMRSQFGLRKAMFQTQKRLRAARDLLLPKMLSGEIDVSRAERRFAEAAE